MKRFILALSVLLTTFGSDAQPPAPKTYPKTIQVTGISELNIDPDEIHVLVTLKEFEKKGKEKTDIGTIRNGFLASVRKVGIADTAIQISSVNGNTGVEWWRKRNQKEELYASITYEIIFHDAQKIDELTDLLDDDATEYFVVSKITHSNLVGLQKQLRIDALKAAKAKAVYLAEAISENVGSAITITEISYPQVFDNVRAYSNTMSYKTDEVAERAKPEFKKLNLKSEMSVVFEIR
ncbi:SIMPL domain-containing protein [Flavitalea antarctica]